MVWRYGTEKPCNLVGRYVTIFADYSTLAATAPYTFEIALCHWGIMGNRIPITDEVDEVIDLKEPIPEPIPPTFS